LQSLPESGRTVPEFEDSLIREVVRRPYRIVYRLVGDEQIHIITVHHGSQAFPGEL
jgi:toxin ParE1/3/4